MGKFPPARMLFVGTVISLGGSFHLGFQLAVTNPTQESLMSFMNGSHEEHYGWGLPYAQAVSIWSVIVATFSIGAVFGSLPIGYVSTRFGRKRGLYISFGMAVLSVVLVIISYHVFSFELYIVARFLMGFSFTLSIGLAGMLLNESSPKECRGFVSTLTCTFSCIGCLLAGVIGMTMVLGSPDLWWYLYITELIIFIIVLAILPFIPESPGFLILRGDEAEARKAIMFFHGCEASGVEAPLNEIKQALKLSSSRMSFIDVFKDKYSRSGALVSMVLSAGVCFSGNSLMNSFAVGILKETGLSPQNAAYGNIGLTGILVVASCVSSVVVDRLGRRPLALFSNGIIVILNAIIFTFLYCFQRFQLEWIGYCLIVTIALSQFCFCCGLGPLCFFIGTETVGQSARGVSQSCATLAQMITRAIVLAVFLPMSQALGQAFAYLILSVPTMMITFTYMYFNLPETKNRSYGEVLEEMEKLPSLSKFLGRKKVADGKRYDFPIPQINGK